MSTSPRERVSRVKRYNFFVQPTFFWPLIYLFRAQPFALPDRMDTMFCEILRSWLLYVAVILNCFTLRMPAYMHFFFGFYFHLDSYFWYIILLLPNGIYFSSILDKRICLASCLLLVSAFRLIPRCDSLLALLFRWRRSSSLSSSLPSLRSTACGCNLSISSGRFWSTLIRWR